MCLLEKSLIWEKILDYGIPIAAVSIGGIIVGRQLWRSKIQNISFNSELNQKIKYFNSGLRILEKLCMDEIFVYFGAILVSY